MTQAEGILRTRIKVADLDTPVKAFDFMMTAGTACTIKITSTQLIVTSTGGTSKTLTFADATDDTIGEIMTNLDAVTGYVVTPAYDIEKDRASTELRVIADTDCLNTEVAITVDYMFSDATYVQALENALQKHDPKYTLADLPLEEEYLVILLAAAEMAILRAAVQADQGAFPDSDVTGSSWSVALEGLSLSESGIEEGGVAAFWLKIAERYEKQYASKSGGGKITESVLTRWDRYYQKKVPHGAVAVPTKVILETPVKIPSAFKLMCDDEDATAATININSDVLKTVITGGSEASNLTVDLTATDYDTIEELIEYLEGQDGYEVVRYDDALTHEAVQDEHASSDLTEGTTTQAENILRTYYNCEVNTPTALLLEWSTCWDLDFYCYKIYRSGVSGADLEEATLVTTIYDNKRTVYLDYNLVSGQKYYYQIVVYNTSTTLLNCLYSISNEESIIV